MIYFFDVTAKCDALNALEALGVSDYQCGLDRSGNYITHTCEVDGVTVQVWALRS